MYADIIVDISREKLDKTFEYNIPKELEKNIHPGVRVDIPFGARKLTGYVISIKDNPSIEASKIKDILGICPASVSTDSEMIELAYFIHEEFGGSINAALKTVIPVSKSVKHVERKTIVLNIKNDEALDELLLKYKKRAKAKFRLLEALVTDGDLSYEEVTKKLCVASATIKAMETEGVISLVSDTVYRNPIKDTDRGEYNITLNDAQNKVYEDILGHMKKNEYSQHLIYGITGSGKTEVYIKLIDEVIKEGKQAIVLIPEIALTFQTVMRFRRKFKDRVSIINSRLSAGERYDQFERAKKGDIDIMIGPRSALFTPFKNLSLIIIDEEHENSYKSETVPKYSTKEVAAFRMKQRNGTLVLGSATPSVDSFYNCVQNKCYLHKLFKRAKKSVLPRVSVVDMRKELENGNKSMFSDELDRLIKDRLEKHEQIMLFLNRRGYAGFISCRKCGHVPKCPHCDVSLSFHKSTNGNTLNCHYCGYSIPEYRLCPQCGSKYIGIFGTGTQKVEEELHKRYPSARVLRMDADTTSGKNGHEEVLVPFANHEADILVGTQMIVKGHDFPLVTLVGVIAADTSLYASDYRAAERTFELLTQAAGRAGRGEVLGNVVIQTYTPDNYSIESAARQDYDGFYNTEINYRNLMHYPPVVHMVVLLITSTDEKKVADAADYIKEKTYALNSYIKDIKIIGPANASIFKLNDMYRKVIYMKAQDKEDLVKIKNELETEFLSGRFCEIYKSVNVSFDFDPYNGV